MGTRIALATDCQHRTREVSVAPDAREESLEEVGEERSEAKDFEGRTRCLQLWVCAGGLIRAVVRSGVSARPGSDCEARSCGLSVCAGGYSPLLYNSSKCMSVLSDSFDGVWSGRKTSHDGASGHVAPSLPLALPLSIEDMSTI